MMSCACSAGPAFEGGDISCGMRATDGAIEACTIDKETMAVSYTHLVMKQSLLIRKHWLDSLQKKAIRH